MFPSYVLHSVCGCGMLAQLGKHRIAEPAWLCTESQAFNSHTKESKLHSGHDMGLYMGASKRIVLRLGECDYT